jgi:hypothetical protein
VLPIPLVKVKEAVDSLATPVTVDIWPLLSTT